MATAVFSSAEPALLTDHYELTMVRASLADGTAHRRCSFEAFTRRLPEGRRFGVVGGTGRLLSLIEQFRFSDGQLGHLLDAEVIDDRTAEYLRDYRFSGDIDGYAEGEPYFGYSPILTVTGPFAEAVIWRPWSCRCSTTTRQSPPLPPGWCWPRVIGR